MIRPTEIQKKANKERVRDTQIEKDYILTWILTDITNNEVLAKSLAFKGGTVLRKPISRLRWRISAYTRLETSISISLMWDRWAA